MAVVVDAWRTANSKASGTSLTLPVFTGTGLAVNDLIVAAIAHDVAAGTYSVSNDAGATITWTAHSLSPTTNAGAVETHYWVGVVTAVSGSVTVTFTHPSLTARAGVAIQLSGAATSGYELASAEATGSSGTPSSGNITTTSGSALVAILGTEGPSGDVFNSDATSSYVVAGRDGTTGGGAASNITLATETRVTGDVATLDHSPTITSRAWASTLIELAGAPVPGAPRSVRRHLQAVNRASTY